MTSGADAGPAAHSLVLLLLVRQRRRGIEAGSRRRCMGPKKNRGLPAAAVKEEIGTGGTDVTRHAGPFARPRRYRAYSTVRTSRMTVTFTSPG